MQQVNTHVQSIGEGGGTQFVVSYLPETRIQIVRGWHYNKNSSLITVS